MDKEMMEALEGVSFLIGNKDMVAGMPSLPARVPFDGAVLDMLNDVSRILMAGREAREYPDVVTFAFWIRKASALKLKGRFYKEDWNIRFGRGVAFHIAPSNVPVNFAYSLAAGLLTGNANIVRVPSKDFPQVRIIAGAFAEALGAGKNRDMAGYVCLVRYGREKAVNDLFSSISDTRIIWGGDAAVEEIRKSPLGPRTGEVTFADRFSLAVIDAGSYLEMDERKKGRTAEAFYNDTYLTDQNACTSPRMVVWMGDSGCIQAAKEEFWGRLHELVKKKYVFQPIQGVNKLTSGCIAAVGYAAAGMGAKSGEAERMEAETSKPGAKKENACQPDGNGAADAAYGVRIESHADNLLVRVRLPRIVDGLMDMKDNSGYFFEYDCADILELKDLCDDKHCQTISYIGNREMLMPLLMSGIRGIDRVVPVGKTMDFDLIWDGYDLYGRLTRIIAIE